MISVAGLIAAAGIVTATLTFASTASSFSIWSNAAVPRVAADPDTQPVELGMKFRSVRDGVVTGVRFYKSRENTGVHTGSIWTSTGTRLAKLTFRNESESGWQQASFSSPVAIRANELYVVSYHTDAGR